MRSETFRYLSDEYKPEELRIDSSRGSFFKNLVYLFYGLMNTTIDRKIDCHQINEKDMVNLFRSHRPDYQDGEQKRDFIYVKDVVSVLYWFLQHKHPDGIFNLGTGQARTFTDLATATFTAMSRIPDIHFIDIPEDIRDKYQYFTEAKMGKLRQAGCQYPFHTLEDGVSDYVQNYLMRDLAIY